MFKIRYLVTIMAAVMVAVSAQAADAEYKGASDYPDLPRIEGTRIGGYQHSEYDAGLFLSAFDAGKLQTVSPEGVRTRILYVGTETQSSLQVFRNYQKAFAQMGELSEVYSCQKGECAASKVGDKVVWFGDNKVPSDFANFHHYGNRTTHKDPMYFYGTVRKGEKLYHVSVFTSVCTNGSARKALNRPVIHLEVLEVADFEASLSSMDASQIDTQLQSQGHVAIYGINFDFNSADLQVSSSSAIAEIAKTLKANPSTNVYVVGHTDGEGAMEYNESLSLQRATSVVNELVTTHGLKSDRLLPVGVGPVAPKASNESESGRALNRRVEVVKRP